MFGARDADEQDVACWAGGAPTPELFPDSKDLAYVREHYRAAFDAQVVEPSVEAWKAIERKEAGYPLYYAIRDLDQRFEGGRDDTIFIFDRLEPTDVIDFWNLRLFRRDVMPVNVHWLAASREVVLEQIRRAHRPLPSNANGVMIGTNVQIGRSLDASAVAAVLDFAASSSPLWQRQRSVGVRASYPVSAP